MNASHLLASIGLQLQNLLQKHVSFFSFGSSRRRNPGRPLRYHGVCIKGRQPERLVACGHILDVEPLLASSLHRLNKLNLEVLDVRSSLHSKTAKALDAVLALDIEDAAKQPEVGHNTQEALAKNEETRNVQKPIGRKSCNCTP